MKDKYAPTTSNTQPMRPEYPAVRKPAKGPLLTTSNVVVERQPRVASEEEDVKPAMIPSVSKRGRRAKA